MNNNFGPWTTTLHNMPPRLDTFWKRRLAMVAALKPIERRRMRVTLLLLAVGIALCAVPTLWHSSAWADQQTEENKSAPMTRVEDRDRQLEDLERKVEELLREVKALRAERTRGDRSVKSNGVHRFGQNCQACHAGHTNMDMVLRGWQRHQGWWPRATSQNCSQCHASHASHTLFHEENQHSDLWPHAASQDCTKCHTSVHSVPWKSSVK